MAECVWRWRGARRNIEAGVAQKLKFKVECRQGEEIQSNTAETVQHSQMLEQVFHYTLASNEAC